MIRVGLVIVLVAVLAALVGPALSPYNPAAQELARRLEPPTLSHPFGLDELGGTCLRGARALRPPRRRLGSSVVGMLVGSIAGYFGGRVVDVIRSLVVVAFPGFSATPSWRSARPRTTSSPSDR